MTNQTMDPIKQIKEAEETVKKQVEKAADDYSQKLIAYKAELAGKNESFREDLKEQGNNKLSNVKKEASELLKSKIATAKAENEKIIQSAESNKKDGVNSIVTTFLEHVK